MAIESTGSVYREQEPKTATGLLGLATVVISLASAQVARADDRLKDFQTAINYMQDDQGCRSIPYSDRQDSCRRKHAEVDRFCKESGPLNCEDVDPKKIQKEIEGVKTDRDTLKAERDNLERQKASLTDDQSKRENEDKTRDTERKLYELERKRGDLEKQVSDATKAVNDRLYIAKACRDARTGVQEAFKDAKSSASHESDADIAPLARQLVDSWEKREPGHEEAIRNVKAAVEKCDRTLDDIGHLGSF